MSKFDRTAQVIKLSLQVATTIAALSVGAAMVQTTVVLNQSTGSVQQFEELLLDLRAGLSGTLEHTDATLMRIAQASDEWAKASQEQRQYWATNSRQAGRVLREAEKTLASFRIQILPQLAQSLENTDANMQEVAQEVSVAVQALQPVLKNLAEASANAARITGDPSIPATLQSTEKIAQEVAEAAENINKTTAHIEKKVEQMTKPASFAARAGLFLLKTIGAVGSFFQGVVK